MPNQALLNALVYRCENGCKWCALPKTFGNWHAIYVPPKKNRVKPWDYGRELFA
ncbi:MAG: transposase [Treponema sp.]|nr:transposase [Treponema sp.]